MIRSIVTRFRHALAIALPVLVLTSTAAQADYHFRGGGAIYSMTDACEAAGYDPNSAYAVSVRYSPSEARGEPPSQVTLGFFTGTEHFSLWGPMAPSGNNFFGGAGRQTWTRFVFYNNRPLLRIVRRTVTERVSASGPDEIGNAREVVMRLRIQNFSNVSGCVVTLVATMRRVAGS